MKIDRSILTANDQKIGDFGDPDKLESSINHLADVIDSNDLISESRLVDSSVSRIKIQNGAVGTQQLDPNILNQPTTAIGQQTKFEQIDEEFSSQWLNVQYPPIPMVGLKGDGTDETTTFKNLINYAVQHLPMTLFFPNATYGHKDLGSIAYKGLTLRGATDRGVIFKCLNDTDGNTALNCDAFWSGQQVGYVRSFNLINIIVEGSSVSSVGLYAQGLAQCSWQNVYVRGCKQDNASIGFKFDDVELSIFTRLLTSNQIEPSGTPLPYIGIQFNTGIRAGVTTGACSNNQFNSCYFEGLNGIGIKFIKGDQNIFVGGASEGCLVKGLEIATGSNINRYNTFISTGFENDNAPIDVDDGGMSTEYINCYSSKYMKLNGHRQKVQGGMFNTIEVTNTAIGATVENVKVNYFGGTGAGFIDGGTTTKWRNIWNNNTNDFMYPSKARTGIIIGASPFTWTNDTGNMVHLLIAGGTVSQLQLLRNGGDPYSLAYNSNVQPMVMVIPPKDGITITYSVTPGISYRELNGF